MRYSKLERVKAGDPISAEKYNDLVDAVNRLMSMRGEDPVEVALSNAGYLIRAPRVLKLWLCAIQSQLGQTSDGVNYYSAKAKLVQYGDAMTDAADTDAITVYDPAGKDRTLASGDLVFAVTNNATGRWEAIVGGSGTASSDCHHLGTTDVLTLPVIAPDDSAYVLGIIDGCLALFPVGDCSTS